MKHATQYTIPITATQHTQTCLGLGFMRTARNLGGSPYLKMLSTNNRTAHTWIHPENASP